MDMRDNPRSLSMSSTDGSPEISSRDSQIATPSLWRPKAEPFNSWRRESLSPPTARRSPGINQDWAQWDEDFKHLWGTYSMSGPQSAMKQPIANNWMKSDPEVIHFLEEQWEQDPFEVKSVTW
ncbi:hypothetical protein [Mosquito VEM virus SDRBAJ]|uniref:hypothetical protein n=1 Tax=Mosquito VEM virus SDRBAJ TaxID=1034806 RepID=UPI000211765E|nr:hypothetical protein EXH99_gp3 [Mosquito VEM virus SDRBAJ]AEF58775.1 hypothetical protein [Mosquito VEM virus SDRBAJ]